MDTVKEYPMAKEDFINRVIELFIEKNDDYSEEYIKGFHE